MRFELCRNGLGRFLRRIDESHLRAHDLLQHRLDKGVVRTTQNQRVNPLSEQRGKIFARRQAGNLVSGPAFFSQGDKERTSGSVHHNISTFATQSPFVGTAANRPFRADHPYPAINADFNRTPRARLDDADHRNLVSFGQAFKSDR